MSLTVKRCLCCALGLLLLVFIVTIPMAPRAGAVSEVLLAVPVISAILGLFAAWGIEISSQGLSGSDLYGWVQDQFNEWWALQQGKQMALELAGLSIWRGMLKVGRDFVNQVREFAEYIQNKFSVTDNSTITAFDNSGLSNDQGLTMALVGSSSLSVSWSFSRYGIRYNTTTDILFNDSLDGYFFICAFGSNASHPGPGFMVVYIGTYNNEPLFDYCRNSHDSSDFVTKYPDHNYLCRFGDSSSYVETTVYTAEFGSGQDDPSALDIPFYTSFTGTDIYRMFINYGGVVTYWTGTAELISLIGTDVIIPGQDIEEGSDAYIDVVGISLESVEQAGTVIQDQVMEGELEVDLTVADSADPPAGSVTQFQTPGLSEVFPFCIPFDIYAFFSVLAADPVAPSFSWDMEVPGLVDYTIEIDLSIFDTVAQVVRTMELLAYCVALAVATRDLIKG